MLDALSYILLASGNDTSTGGEVRMLQTLVLEPCWLSSMACGYQADPALIAYFDKAQTHSSKFSMCTVHGLQLLYYCSKPGLIQFVIPDKLGLQQFLLLEMHFSPLAGHLGAHNIIFAL